MNVSAQGRISQGRFESGWRPINERRRIAVRSFAYGASRDEALRWGICFAVAVAVACYFRSSRRPTMISASMRRL
jgi:hypothetical protein